MFNPTYLQKLNWRYATKKFDPSKKVSDEDRDSVLEAMRLAASSFGFQPWKFVVVTNPELRAKLREAAYGQPQITDASFLIVLCARKTMDENYVKKLIELTSVTRGVPVEALAEYQGMLMGSVQRRTPEELLNWMKHQVYIPLGFALSACAENDIDACPMEGFDNAKFNEILELDKEGIESVALCAVGYRAADDPAAAMKKVRFSKDDILVWKK